ncbi:autoinducer binding domain-containing protein [Phaeobacter inhibens]|uniref:autoinducer binding domain-containing protein n=1 Tax=Phaeobacter inhibens TaxID=221822 RepID=UPI0021A903B3|nr:autoinducer binding domain-containing protein [Phaeobacter inhibens]UWR97719.1 autoinducer binding domain-containing protein [Phaeobacter inhibens]
MVKEFEMNPHVKLAFDTLSRFSDFGCAIGILFSNGHPKYSHFTYPPAFLEAYHERDMALRDATLRYGLTCNGRIGWSELERQGWDAASFELARSFGIEDGVCFALEIEGHKTIASISHRKGCPPSDATLDRCMDALSLATLSSLEERRTLKLSQGTLDYLSAISQGGKLNDVAGILGLTYSGARARRVNALDEIGANTDAQAVVIAIREGAFSPYRTV